MQNCSNALYFKKENMSNDDIQELVDRLKKYVVQAYNAHDTYIAEDLNDAARLISEAFLGED